MSRGNDVEGAPGGGGVTAWPARHELRAGLTAAFFGRAGAAGRLLAGRGIPGRPALFGPGRTLIIVAYQDFAASPVGPYRQVSISLPVHLPGRRGARAPLLLPLLLQALWNTETFYRDLYFYVAAIPVSAAAAVPYSGEIWGEPAWPAAIEAGPGARRKWLEVRVGSEPHAPSPAPEPAGRRAAPGSASGESLLVFRAAGGGLPLREKRGYRLISRLDGRLLADVMRVEAPCRLGFGPGRASLELGSDGRLDPLREVLGPRPAALQTMAHGAGTVTFGGPSAWEVSPRGL